MSGVLALAAFGLTVGTGFVWFRRARAVDLPEDRTGFVIAMALAVVLGISAFALGTGWLSALLAGLALLGAGFYLFTVGISAQKGGSGAFQVGSPVPDFSAPDETGRVVALSSFAGKPLLLKFFRAHW